MRKTAILAFLLGLIVSITGHAQRHDSLKTVQLHATVDATHESISLQWPQRPDASQYTVYRKFPDGMFWGSPIATLPGTDTSWTDENVEAGKIYNYRVQRQEAGVSGNGYIYSGIEAPARYNMGRVIVVLDTSLMKPEHPLFQQYLQDLYLEGWATNVAFTHRDSSITGVKAKIVAAYEEDPRATRALVLLGRVPVPYSGFIFPDGHGPGSGDHQGAWPADGYYGDMNGAWTDATVNDETASDPRNHNVPGDGKFDQSIIASDLELETGRIDFSKLPVFVESELELLEKYFRKNHAYRRAAFRPQYRGLIENNFAGFEEGFGQNGQKNFTAMFGPDEVHYRDYDNLKSESYLWAYACGAGSYQSSGGIGNSAGFASDSLQAVFTMHFGSFFGDWDSPANNFLKSALGSGTVLANTWAGRPNWAFHPMAMGETIGYCARLSQNNPGGQHDPGFANRWVHTALLGDPTLRMYAMQPPSGLLAEEVDGSVELNWEASGDAAGYHLFMRPAGADSFAMVNVQPITGTTFTYDCPSQGEYEWMVRAVQLVTSASGSFYNLSPGASTTLEINESSDPLADFSADVPTVGDTVYFENLSVRADSFHWDFGDGGSSSEPDPSHIYQSEGSYLVTLTAYNDCGTDVTSLELNINITSVEEIDLASRVVIYPNPADEKLNIKSEVPYRSVRLLDAMGRLISHLDSETSSIDLSSLPPGLLIIELELEREVVRKKVVKQ